MKRVPSYFPPGGKADLAFIGEAPGNEEVEEGVPLVGPSGKVFNQMLRTARVDRDACFITNVFDEKLPENSLDKWTMNKTQAKKAKVWGELEKKAPIVTKGASGRWLMPEYWGHVERLFRELEEVKPKVIVPLGTTALWAICDVTHIMAWRGTISELEMSWGTCRVIPTIHPAYVIRAWKSFVTVAGDIKKAADEVERVRRGETLEDTLLSPEFVLNPSLDDIRKWWEEEQTYDGLLGVDIETGGGQIKCVGFSTEQGPGINVPFVSGADHSLSYWGSVEEECEAWHLVGEMCRASRRKVLQNGTYDLYWLYRIAGIEVRGYEEDTRLMHHAAYPEMPKSLEFLGPTYCRIKPWKTMRTFKAEKKDD